MSKPRRVAVIGAGALGLGFLGPSFAGEAEIVFLDIDAKRSLIEGLEDHRCYWVGLAGPWVRSIEVHNVRGLLATSPEAARVLAESDLCFTAVGVGNLPTLAPLLREAGRLRKRGNPLAVLAAENGRDVARGIEKLAGPRANLNVADTVMGRMCRFQEESEAGTVDRKLFGRTGPSVLAEEFYGIPYLQHQGFPALPFSALQPCDQKRFALEEDVKLYAHNCVHGMFACAAARRDKERISEVRNEPVLLERAWTMLNDELRPALIRRHRGAFDPQAYLNYAVQLMGRILSEPFADTVARGIRGAAEKLRPSERWVSALRFIRRGGRQAPAYVAAFADVVAVSGLLNGRTLQAVLTEHCGFLNEEAEELALEIGSSPGIGR